MSPAFAQVLFHVNVVSGYKSSVALTTSQL